MGPGCGLSFGTTLGQHQGVSTESFSLVSLISQMMGVCKCECRNLGSHQSFHAVALLRKFACFNPESSPFQKSFS